jgi:hypothetical protein
LQERFAYGRVAVGDHVCDVRLERVEVLVTEWLRGLFFGRCELVASRLEL